MSKSIDEQVSILAMELMGRSDITIQEAVVKIASLIAQAEKETMAKGFDKGVTALQESVSREVIRLKATRGVKDERN